MPDFLPTKDGELLAWSQNFDGLITATPGAFGLLPADATAYNAKHLAFESALAIVAAPDTRTKPAVVAKDTAKRELSDLARLLSKKVQGTATVTDAQKTSLGLDVPAPRTPIQPPDEAPIVQLVSMNGWMAKFRVEAASSERRKPPGAVGVNIFTFVGPIPPAEIREWVWEGDTSRTTFEVSFPGSLAAGTKVWITCNWKTARFQTSPACAPVGLLIGGGVTTLAA